MATSAKLRLRNLWFSFHKWIGILLAVLIVPISISGAALVWHDWLDETLNPGRYAVTSSEARLTPSQYAEAATPVLKPGERVSVIRYPEQGEGPVVVTAMAPTREGAARGGPPVRTQVWLDPATGKILDSAPSNAGAVRFLHVLHGSLMVPGMGRQIVGWVGVFMLISSLTGIWLWWPVSGSVKKGFKWNRQPRFSANLHHQTGFWIAIPLAMLSFTGMWISFPGFFGPLSGAPAQKGGRPTPSAPLAAPAMTPEAVVQAASAHATGAILTLTWPTEKTPDWKVAYEREGSPAEVEIADAGGEVTPPKPPRPETIARTMRRWHDGTGMGVVWQVVIFLGGIIPAILGVTGIMMWLNTRTWRGDLARRKKAKLAAAPAE
ncbi:PepSY domain-containing protein [Allosphingosinicella flava]|uniref:PepSY domain-containing protein n=1 Tax=Allosphingosinicella flava TaxID=2771430 RepID=A0A7T2GJ51_9SPHN|nr:PepSY-associated TM helix domain-containing protein [Sphingosinicella flava]QPQ54837.1 PepSY domain-containing protein [Sphingosinicella flava]